MAKSEAQTATAIGDVDALFADEEAKRKAQVHLSYPFGASVGFTLCVCMFKGTHFSPSPNALMIIISDNVALAFLSSFFLNIPGLQVISC